MIYAAVVIILLYYLSFIIYYQYLMPAAGKKYYRVFLIGVVIVILYLCLNNNSNSHRLTIPIHIAVMMGGLWFTTGMNWLQSFYGGSFCVLSAYSFRGIFIGIGALVLRSNTFLSNAMAYYLLTAFALPLGLIGLNFLRNKFFPEEKMKQFLYNNSQLKLLGVFEIAMALNLTAIDSGRYFEPKGLWFTEFALTACLITLGILIYVNYQALQSTELAEYRSKTQILEEHCNQQLQQYQSCIKNVENFQTFKHDYVSMMAPLKSLIRMQEHDKAIQLIDNIYDELPKGMQSPKKYSDNVVLDIILKNLASRCEEFRIRFTFDISVSLNTSLSLVDAIRVFSNIADNAIEACQKVPVSERFIAITSGRDDHWVTLEVRNAYDGKAILENGNFITTKSEKQKHGLGLCIVKDIVQSVGGFAMFEARPESRSFLLRVHMPQANSKL